MNDECYLILDANTLIDFMCEPAIIKLISSYVGQVFLAAPVLREVRAVDEQTCLEYGIKLFEPSLEQLSEAANKGGRLSFQDNLCLILARENGWTCITNDKPLRRQCELEGVPLVWGIELICILVESGGFSKDAAKDVIEQIHTSNPRYITKDIVDRAMKRLR